MPYSAEINDITMMVSHHHESDVLLKRTVDAFDRLYEESAESARVLAIGVHPYVTGAAHRIKYFEQLYEYINRHDVVHWTGQQIFDWYAGAGAGAVIAGLQGIEPFGLVDRRSGRRRHRLDQRLRRFGVLGARS